MSDVIARAAEAILQARYPHFADFGASAAVRDATRAQASAALQAALDPTDEALVEIAAEAMELCEERSSEHFARAAILALRSACSVPNEEKTNV